MTKRSLVTFVVLALASFALAACGGGDDSSSSSTAAETTDTGGSGGGSTIEVAADPGGDLAFTETDLTATAGSNTIDFTNDSGVPHNVEIEDANGDDVAGTEVSAESSTTTAELEPGTYTFYCSVPGHREAGMEGTITVE